MHNEVHVTYLDTIGRPTVVLKKNSLTDEHKGMVYVSPGCVSKYHPRC